MDQELTDVVSAFEKIEIKDSIKVTKKLLYKNYSIELLSKSKASLKVLEKFHPEFKNMNPRTFCGFLIDSSILNRKMEFSIECESNDFYAYLGDMYLSFYLAKKCIKLNKTPQEFQTYRSVLTSNKNLSKMFDKIGLTKDMILKVDDNEMSFKKKSTVIEALIGISYMMKIGEGISNRIIKEIIGEI